MPAVNLVLLWFFSLAGQQGRQGQLAHPGAELRWQLRTSSRGAGSSLGSCRSREGTGLAPREDQDTPMQAWGGGRCWGVEMSRLLLFRVCCG